MSECDGRVALQNGFFVSAGGKKGGKKGAVNGKKEEESDIFKLVKMIMQRNFDPVSSKA